MFTFRYDETTSNLFVANEQLGIRSLEISEAHQWINEKFSVEHRIEALGSLKTELRVFLSNSYDLACIFYTTIIEDIYRYANSPIQHIQHSVPEFANQMNEIIHRAIYIQDYWVRAQLHYHQYHLSLELSDQQREYHVNSLQEYNDLLRILNTPANTNDSLPQNTVTFEHYTFLLNHLLYLCDDFQQYIAQQRSHITEIINARTQENTMTMAHTYAANHRPYNPAASTWHFWQYYNLHYQYNLDQEHFRYAQIFELLETLNNFSAERIAALKNTISGAVLAERKYIWLITQANMASPVAKVVDTTPAYVPQVFACAHRGWGVADNGQWQVVNFKNTPIKAPSENTLQSILLGTTYCKFIEIDVKFKPLPGTKIPVLLVEHTELDAACKNIKEKQQQGLACNPTPENLVTTFKDLVTNLRQKQQVIEMQVEIKQDTPRMLVIAILDAYANAFAAHSKTRTTDLKFHKISLLLPTAFHDKLPPIQLKEFTTSLHDWATNVLTDPTDRLKLILDDFIDPIYQLSGALQANADNLKLALLYNGLIPVAAPVATCDLFSKDSIGKGFRLKSRALACELPAGIEQAKAILQAGCDLDLLLFDTDTAMVTAISDLQKHSTEKRKISISATHCDMRAARNEEVGPIYAAARSLAIARQSGCDVSVKTDRPDIFSKAIEIVNLLENANGGFIDYKIQLNFLRSAECDMEQVKKEIAFFKHVRPSTMCIVPEFQKWTRTPNEEPTQLLWEDAAAGNYLRLAVPEGAQLPANFVFARTCSNPRQPVVREVVRTARGEVRRLSGSLKTSLSDTLQANSSESFGASLVADTPQNSNSGSFRGQLRGISNGLLSCDSFPLLPGQEQASTPMTYAMRTNVDNTNGLIKSQSMPEMSMVMFGSALAEPSAPKKKPEPKKKAVTKLNP